MTLAEAYARRASALQLMQNMGVICRNKATPQQEAALKRSRTAFQNADAQYREIAKKEQL